MNLKSFKPKDPCVIESWGGAHHVFEAGARDVVEIAATPSGILIRFERNQEGMPKSATILVTGPGYGQVAEEQDDAER